MIDKTKINTAHQQYWNTCLLSNYGVCCNFLNQTKIIDFFADYFKEFRKDFADPYSFFNNGYLKVFLNEPLFAIHYHTKFSSFNTDYSNYLNGACTTEEILTKYAAIFIIQFHLRTYPGFVPFNQSQDRVGGYRFIKLLHDNINQSNFIDCRNKVKVLFLPVNDKGLFSNNPYGLKCKNDLIDLMRNEEIVINAYDFKVSHSLTYYCDSTTNLFFKHDTNDPNNDEQVDDNWIENFRDFLIYEKIASTQQQV